MSKNPFQNFLVRFAPGQRIFTEAEEGTTMYIVQAGRVLLFREIDGQKRVVGTMDKGDFFGEMSILEGLPRTLSAEAVDECELIEINSMTFDRMIRGNIEIAIRMLRKLSIRLREAERRIAEVHPSALRAASSNGGTVASASRATSSEANGVRLEIESSQAAFAVRADETLIGRYDPVTEQRPDIDLTDLDIKRSVSRRHARILRNAEGFAVVEEVGALNGTLVNGDPLVPGQPHLLADGDRLSVGTITMVFRV